MTDQKKNDSLEWGKLILPLLVTLLIGSEGWQYWKAPSKIQEDTRVHSKTEFNDNVDSLRKIIANEEFVKGVFSEGASRYKDLQGKALDKYLTNVFLLADKGLKNDSMWSNVQLPFLMYLIENRTQIDFIINNNILVPYEDKTTLKLEFNWVEGHYPITERNVSGGVIRAWRDGSDDQHTIQMISSIKDR